MIQAICDAIHRHQLLLFSYEPGERLVEPYVYGVGDGGHVLLRAYQLAGDSYSREEGWKLFHVEKMTNIIARRETFETLRPGYMRNDPSMSLIYCER